MLDDGSYRVYHVYHTNGKPSDQLMARFLIDRGEFHLLEDHDNVISDVLHDGPMTYAHEKFLWTLSHSGYYRIVHDEEINEGHHHDLVEDLDIGPTEPDAEYILTGAQNEPQRVEMYGDSVILDGQKMTNEQVDYMMEQVRLGAYTLAAI